ncbi:MAG: SDR family NAD(P)-dependent oxidoreductase [Bacteroidales bacterium]|nr:SDR family NAD(P)-dependent oxidoreductase [Bacteroidales bacterium]
MEVLKSKTALITGASRGIGIYIAKALAREGMNLILVARNGEALKDVENELSSLPISVSSIPADIGQRSQLMNLVDITETKFNGVDVLINNAGIELALPYAKIDPDIIDQIMEVNLRAPMILTRLLLPKMISRGEGHIVNIASIAGLFGAPYEEAYAASKHGLIGFTRSLRFTALSEGYPIGASVISPGYISEAGMYQDNIKNTTLKAPGSFGTSPPDDVARAVIRAIKKNKSDIIVNSKPLRPLLALQSIAPSITSWFAAKTGSLEFGKSFAQKNLKELSEK